jgi:hypothetical protein
VQHRLFRLIDASDSVRPVAAAVFEPSAQHKLKELGGEFVMLEVGMGCVHCYRAPPQLLDQSLFLFGSLLEADSVSLPQIV